mmetsp:Transcript_42104/g.127733  ORF Transcript_42104/g.127733 Transcript_42104/m.127733 type:complete len:89 (-) Transcript_42104:119-385(-)
MCNLDNEAKQQLQRCGEREAREKTLQRTGVIMQVSLNSWCFVAVTMPMSEKPPHGPSFPVWCMCLSRGIEPHPAFTHSSEYKKNMFTS